MRIKPTIFIGSSSERLKIAGLLKENLEKRLNVAVTVWDDPDGIFGLGQSTLQSILTAPHFFDYSILIIAPDDEITSRGQTVSAPRDNVLFELGLFLGSQGRSRSFAVVLKRADIESRIKIPSDLAGENLLHLPVDKDGIPSETALEAVILRIARTLDNQRNLSYLTPLPSTVLAITYYRNFLLPMCELLTNKPIIYPIGGPPVEFDPRKFKVTIAVPSSLNSASRSGQRHYKEQNDLQVFSTEEGDTRPFPFFVALRGLSEILEFFDVPTTLRGCSEAVRVLLAETGAVGKSKIQELAEAREVENFAETLQYAIDSDPDGQHFSKRIAIEFWK